MPYLKIQTNLPLAHRPNAQAQACVGARGRELGKPEEFVMIALQPTPRCYSPEPMIPWLFWN